MAIQKKSLPSNTDAETFIRSRIKAYLISHGHLDHISGFLLNSPNDQAGKYILGLNETISIIRQHYFNNQAWADFASTGIKVRHLRTFEYLSDRKSTRLNSSHVD